MRSKYSFRPRIEALEDRAVPATISLVGSNLFISRQAGPLTVSTVVGGDVKVQDGASSVSLSGVTNVFITGTKLADSITLDGTAEPFSGNVLINAGNGNDEIFMKGIVSGNLTILTGLGDDEAKVLGAGLTVGGNLQFTNSAGSSLFKLSGDLTVGTNLTATGVSEFKLAGNALDVGNNLSVSALNTKALLFNVNSASALTVGKAFTVTGSSANDTVQILGDVTIGGNTNLNLRGGANLAKLVPVAPGTLSGSFNYTGGAGNDTVTMGANLTLGGNATLNLGAGTNSLTTAASQTNGNFNVTAAGAGNTLNFTDAVLSGNANLNLGNGTNTLTFTTAPAGLLNLRAGNGTNTLNITPAAPETFNGNLLFGNGTNTVTLNADTTISGRLIGGSGTNTFNQNGATILPPWLQIGF